MDNRLLSYLTILVVGLIAVLFALKLLPVFWAPMGEKYISFNQVRGIEVQVVGNSYKLSVAQQNTLIKYLNQAIPVAPPAAEKDSKPLNFDKIIIYRLEDKSDIILAPLTYDSNGNLFFKVPEWNEHGVFKDVSGGKIQSIIIEAIETKNKNK